MPIMIFSMKDTTNAFKAAELPDAADLRLDFRNERLLLAQSLKEHTVIVPGGDGAENFRRDGANRGLGPQGSPPPAGSAASPPVPASPECPAGCPTAQAFPPYFTPNPPPLQ